MSKKMGKVHKSNRTWSTSPFCFSRNCRLTIGALGVIGGAIGGGDDDDADSLVGEVRFEPGNPDCDVKLERCGAPLPFKRRLVWVGDEPGDGGNGLALLAAAID